MGGGDTRVAEMHEPGRHVASEHTHVDIFLPPTKEKSRDGKKLLERVAALSCGFALLRLCELRAPR